MSRASDYAVSVGAAVGNIAAVQATRPLPITLGKFHATVTDEGGCHLDGEAYLLQEDALALADWLTATFGG